MKLYKRKLEDPYEILLSEQMVRDILGFETLSRIRLDQIREALHKKWGEELGVPSLSDRTSP